MPGSARRHRSAWNAVQTERAEIRIQGDADGNVRPPDYRKTRAVREAERSVIVIREDQSRRVLVLGRHAHEPRQTLVTQSFSEMVHHTPTESVAHECERFVEDEVARH